MTSMEEVYESLCLEGVGQHWQRRGNVCGMQSRVWQNDRILFVGQEAHRDQWAEHCGMICDTSLSKIES